MVSDPKSLVIPIIVALTLHVGVVALFWLEWPASQMVMAEPLPKHIMANVVQTENTAVKKREQDRLKAIADKKRREERLRKEKAAKEKAAKEKAAKEKAAKEKAAKEKAAKEKAVKEKAAKEKAAKEKAAKEKAAKEKAAKEKAAKEKAAKEKAAEEKAAEEKAEAERRLAEQAAEEERQARVAEREATSAESMDMIRSKVSSLWQYPPNALATQEVIVRINCVPTGEVISISIIKGSGNAALDRSVEQAIMKASPLPVPNDILLFEQRFRTFTMKFRPENSSW